MAKTKEKIVSVGDVIKQIKDKYGDESIGTLHDHPKSNIDSISTGSFGLNAALGIGGLPRGRITEVYGPEASGKTTLALSVIAEAQKGPQGAECAYIDVEHAMDPEYATKLGVDIKKLLISQPDSAEQALDMVETMIRSNTFDVIVIDSVASLTPKDEMEGEMGQQFMGKQARLMGQAMRKITAISAKSKTVLIFINQIRMIMNVMPGQSPEITPGGKALKFAASIRLDIRRIAQIKKGEETVGGRVRVKVTKNKVAAPFKQTEFDLMYGEGISKEGELLALGEKHGIISKAGATYSFNNETIGRGYDASRKVLKENPELSSKIYEGILKEIAGSVPQTEAAEVNE
jgi:recombination protein RecA